MEGLGYLATPIASLTTLKMLAIALVICGLLINMFGFPFHKSVSAVAGAGRK
ncbi:hypothetical protein [Paludibacterium denitrificans]|uniref:hypothetical protein n=1 Tax=Paludibacterium denitrificans TaxID=2675226 RepID=UPI001E3B0476|nr:hypothetical protein [Paludibacterium denitrificans]